MMSQKSSLTALLALWKNINVNQHLYFGCIYYRKGKKCVPARLHQRLPSKSAVTVTDRTAGGPCYWPVECWGARCACAARARAAAKCYPVLRMWSRHRRAARKSAASALGCDKYHLGETTGSDRQTDLFPGLWLAGGETEHFSRCAMLCYVRYLTLGAAVAQYI